MILNYIASNIPLFSISAVIIFILIRNWKVRKKESVYFLIFTSIVLFLSFVCKMEKYSQMMGYVEVGTIFTSLGYILRPILLYLFVLLANMDQSRSKKFMIAMIVPLILNFVVYCLPLFFGVPGISTVVFYYEALADGTAQFMRGSFLNFFSHAICVFYLGVIVYVSTMRFNGKHRRDGIVLVLVVIIIIATVATEMLADRNDLLNIVSEICLMVNYIFIISVNSSKDPLTGLYDRRTYYEDISRYRNLVNGVVQIDMNGLKYLNDNFGHDSGDVALKELASIFLGSLNPSIMCAYRLSGDEFLILMFQGKEENLLETVQKIKEKMTQSKYCAAIGYCFIDKKDNNLSFEEAMKQAEDYMYKDKDEYYKNSKIDRRK